MSTTDYEPPPYDADCDPETGDPLPVPHADEWHYRAARAVIYDNCDRRDIKWGFGQIDLDVRREIVATQAAIIKAAYEQWAGVDGKPIEQGSQALLNDAARAIRNESRRIGEFAVVQAQRLRALERTLKNVRDPS